MLWFVAVVSVVVNILIFFSAIISGSSKALMGVGKLDNVNLVDEKVSEGPGVVLDLRQGDVVVHPAGTAHSNITEEDHYRYLSFFPQVSKDFSYEDELDITHDIAEDEKDEDAPGTPCSWSMRLI